MNEIVARVVASIVLMMLAAIVMLAGFGFLIAALYLTLLRYMEPSAAALAVGLAALLLALVLMLVARRRGQPRRRRAFRPQPVLGAAPSGDIEADAAALGLRLADEGRRLARSHAKGAALTALCAGLVIGISPRLRRTLWRFLQ